MTNFTWTLVDETKDLRCIVEHGVEDEQVSRSVGGFFDANNSHGMACIKGLLLIKNLV